MPPASTWKSTVAREGEIEVLRVFNTPPVDYSLCNQTVTLYHAVQGDPFSCSRVLFHGAFLDQKRVKSVDKTGSNEVSSFLLVLPSGWDGRPVWQDRANDGQVHFSLAPGDKVLLGEGPEIKDRTEWAGFIPAKVPGLVVVRDVDVKYWHGKVCHIEAGG